MFIRNGKRFNINTTLTHEGVTYPSRALADPSVRTLLGITEIPDPERKSDEFYYVTEQEEAPYLINTPKSTEQLTQLLASKIKQHRDTLTDSGGCKVEVSPGVFKWFHTDAKSKVQQLALAMAGANLAENLQWKTMDGSWVPMTPALAQAVYAAQMIREQAIYFYAETQIFELGQFTTVEEFEAFDWRAGWVESYNAGGQ